MKDKLKNFKAIAVKGNEEYELNLSDYKGKRLIIYFYPKDNTSGCSLEASDFKDYFTEFNQLGYEIIGVSKDSVKSHIKFIEKYNIPFPLISDEDTSINQLFEVWQLKKMAGREYMGTVRSTFVLDEDLTVIKEYRKVKVKGHVEEVLDFVKSY